MSHTATLERAPAADQSFEVRPFAVGTGAEIVGLDLSRELTANDFARIKRAHLDHHVVVFRDQRITPQQHIDFSRRFGKLMIHVLHQFHLAGHPEILIISNIVENGQPVGTGRCGQGVALRHLVQGTAQPGLAAARAGAARRGRATRCSPTCTGAWDALPRAPAPRRRGPQGRALVPGPLQAPAGPDRLAPRPERRAGGPGAGSRAPGGAHPPRDRPQGALRERGLHHPHRRPARGRKPLQVLGEIFAHSVKPEFVYRHKWQPHDLLFWDNRSVIRLAGGTPDHLRRKLYRTTIEGDAPF